MLQYLVLIGAAANLFGSLSYIKSILYGNTRPNWVSWLMWSSAPIIATAAELYKGAGWAALPVFMSGFGPLLVFIFSLFNRKSYWKLGPFDYLCGLCSALALILWGITNEPIIAIVFAIASDAFALFPTLKKAWGHPESESAMIYAVGVFNALTAFAAVKEWGFTELGFPIYLILADSALVIAIYRTQLKLIFAK